MDFKAVTEPVTIEGDKNNFALPVFERIAGLCARGDFETLGELKQFLLAEAEESDRQSDYLRAMQRYFHEKAAIAKEMEAKALRMMAMRVD